MFLHLLYSAVRSVSAKLGRVDGPNKPANLAYVMRDNEGSDADSRIRPRDMGFCGGRNLW